MDYVKCDKCGGTEFIRIFSIPVTKDKSKIIIEERKLICANKGCNDHLTKDEVNAQLGL